MKVSVADFDGTLFVNRLGVIAETRDYLLGKNVYILTFRGLNQADFIRETLTAASVNVVGIACADSRNKDAFRKLALLRLIEQKYEVEEVIDDDSEVIDLFRANGIEVIHPQSLVRDDEQIF